ncbi:MAG TPA: O-antigen ligase family protein, partial [Pirellulales bacterium]|nr:O-antigen ligase family protein [Pirellulales bacterium]
EMPIYQGLILCCLLSSLSQVLAQLKWRTLVRQPIVLCVVGMFAAVFLSHAAHLDLWKARFCANEFSKVLIYFLLLVAVVNSPRRLRTFLLWLLACITVLAAIALLQYHEVIHVPTLTVLEYMDHDADAEQAVMIKRLRSTGPFHDPNDLSMLLVLGTLLGAFFLTDRKYRLALPALAAALGVFGYALALTKSRGGLLALAVGLGALFQARYGWKKAILLAAVALPTVLVVFKGRQTDIGGALANDTGQERIQLWSEGLVFLRRAPLFGIGQNQFAEEVDLVAHNSFVHCFAELGFFGGTIFLLAWLYPIRTIYRLGNSGLRFAEPRMARLRPYLLGAVAGYAVSMLSVSRSYVVPTYTVLGLAAAYLRDAVTVPALAGTAFDRRLVKFAIVSSAMFVAAVYVFVRVFARWSPG